MLKKPQRRLQEPRQDPVAVIPQLHPTQLCNIADSPKHSRQQPLGSPTGKKLSLSLSNPGL